MKGHEQGRTKALPAPLLNAKGAGSISMTKRSPCQFGLAPRGDCPPPLKWALGRPRAEGCGAQTLPPPPTPPGSGVHQGQDPGVRGQSTGTGNGG